MKPHIESGPSLNYPQLSEENANFQPHGAPPMHPSSDGCPAGKARTHPCPDVGPRHGGHTRRGPLCPSAQQPHTCPLMHSVIALTAHAALWDHRGGCPGRRARPFLLTAVFPGLAHRRGPARLAETGQKETASELSAQDSHGWRAGMILILKAENSS